MAFLCDWDELDSSLLLSLGPLSSHEKTAIQSALDLKW